MLSMIDKAIYLRKVPLFEGLVGEELRALAAISREQTFRRDEILFRESSSGPGLYVVVDGSVEVFREEGPKRHSVHRYLAGDSFGAMSLLSDAPRALGAAAAEDALCLFIPRSAFIDLLERQPSIAVDLIEVLSERLRQGGIAV